jgi:carbonic anhydrase/acetyltransferase-like protein (isoleucine patch superfamily)
MPSGQALRVALPSLSPDLCARLDRHLGKSPCLGAGVHLARGAVVVGDVILGDFCSVWHNAVLRGDINRIEVAHHTNIQDNAVVHLSDDRPCVLGAYVTVGHAAIVHACSVGDEVLVGMGSVVLDGAEVGARSIIGAKALVLQGMRIPPGSLVMGLPARVVRPLTEDEQQSIRGLAEKYVALAAWCRERESGLTV